MRTIIVSLSVLIIFAGIFAVYYVDFKTDEKKSAAIAKRISEAAKVSVFSKRQSMKEIDSITASINYPYTIHNAVVHSASDSTKGMAKKI